MNTKLFFRRLNGSSRKADAENRMITCFAMRNALRTVAYDYTAHKNFGMAQTLLKAAEKQEHRAIRLRKVLWKTTSP